MQSSNEDDTISNSSSNTDDSVTFTPITNDLPANQILMVDINHGYTFRSVVDTIQSINMEGNFIFTKDKIFYCENRC